MSDELERLFRREYSGLVRALAVSAGDPDRAADVVQDAFVQASKHWRRVRDYDDPAAWIRRVAINRLIDQHRSGDRATRRDEALAHEAAVRRPPMNTDCADLDLARAVADLPERQRLVVCLHYLADLPIDQVASALDIAPGTVKSQLHDARQGLLRRLEDDDDDR